MANLHALIIEDDLDFATEIESAVRSEGYRSETLGSWKDFESWASDLSEATYDLVVLDRQLPLDETSPAQVDLGTVIFEHLLAVLPGIPIIHLTGHSDIDHARDSLMGRSRISVTESTEIDTVYYYRKSDFVEFEKCIASLAALLHEVDDIELIHSDELTLSPRHKRLLRRIAHAFSGLSISVSAMGGGLTDAPVWHCRIKRSGQPAVEVVAKISGRGVSYSLLQESTNGAANVVAPYRHISGLCYGQSASITQLAGRPIESLHQVMRRDMSSALNLGIQALNNLQTPGTENVVELASLVAPFITWEKLAELAEEFSIDLPRPSKKISASFSIQHGDLHGGNILVVNDTPYIIDLDSEGMMSSLADPVTLFFSPFFHPDSPLTLDDKSPYLDLVSIFYNANSASGGGELSEIPERVFTWISGIGKEVSSRTTSSNEFWSLTLAYGARQLRFSDIRASQVLTQFALSMFIEGARRLT